MKVHEITPEKRLEVRRQLWASQPLKQHHLGRYVQFGSQDEWTVEHYIELADGEWTITVVGPDEDEQSVTSEDISELVDGAADLGYDADDLIRDLRKSRKRQLVALAAEIERTR